VRVLRPPLMPEEAASRTRWFIQLRWLAAVGVLGLALVGRFALQLQLDLGLFAGIAVGIAAYNAVFLWFSRKERTDRKWHRRFATIQVAADILALTALMHVGGGVENPFLSFFLFHTIIAAILLPWWQLDIQVLFASGCVGAVALAELTGVLPHRHVNGFLPVELCNDWRFALIVVSSLGITLCVTAFLAPSISERLHEREKQLADANEVLAEQDRLKSQYVMRVAHDLAAPAGMITSCLKIVTQGLAGPIPDKALDMVQRAEHKGEYLGHLIKDLLSLSRIKAAREIPKTQVELSEIVSQVFEDVQSRAAEKNLTLRQYLLKGAICVHGNASAIHELFGNLITNAVKYTLVGGHVQVSASESDHEVTVKVQDDGVGIPAEAIAHVFEEFFRADNVKAETVEGTGLGLSIVTGILKVHGGRIWVDSVEGEGTTFSFTLPRSEVTDA